MLKLLLITEKSTAASKDDTIISGNIIASAAPGEQAITAIKKFNPDLVVSSCEMALSLNAKIIAADAQPRTSISASTHQGIQLVQVADIYYFQAEHKYVVAHHTAGELLIEDPIAALEQEFARDFIRIHRKTLVAIARISQLVKDEQGRHYIKLIGNDVALDVSRRQLPKVRKIILGK